MSECYSKWELHRNIRGWKEIHEGIIFFKKANLVNYNHKGLSTSNVDGQDPLEGLAVEASSRVPAL